MSFEPDNVLHILKKVPHKYRGPGGAVAVLKDGNLLSQHVWGYADMDKRIAMTPEVLFPICSITKQFVSALLLDLAENPPTTMDTQKGKFQDQMLAALREILPPQFVDDAGMTVENLIDMCSGLRDYWALCTVEGSRPDTPYSLDEHNPDMLRRLKSLHFQPGTEYSYSNTNFNVVERLIERVTNDTLDNLLTERILRPAKMATASLCPRTDRFPAPIVGYEGSEKFGFFPAPNFIEWSADAGMVASLNDMVAYEQYFDHKHRDAQSSYEATITPRPYKNGQPSYYRYGLRHADIDTHPTVGHGGALRGFKLSRRYVPSERLSVIVLFNHSASAAEATDFLIKQMLNVPNRPALPITPHKSWVGNYVDFDTQLSVRITSVKQGELKLLYSRATETLKLQTPTRATNPDIEAWIDDDGETVHIHRLEDNRVLHPIRLAAVAVPPAVQGTFRCEETESSFICAGDSDSGMLYAMFDGCFGRGPPHLMTYLGANVWVFADPRAMDDTPPGDWTCVFERDNALKVVRVTIGCWLARKLVFERV